jgi:predicted chitinase
MEKKQKIRLFTDFLNSVYEAANGRLDSSDLAPIPDATGKSTGHKLNPQAAKAYEEMVAAAKAEGVEWGITDSYRPYEVQDRIFDWDKYNATGLRRKKGTGVPAAYPGTSNHGWGSAVDLKVRYGDSAHTWLTNNAAKFGFSNPFSNPRTEPWHWEHLASAGKSQMAPREGGKSVIPKRIVIDSDMVSRLIAKLKEKNFSQEDLKKFTSTASIKSGKGERFSGGSKISDENMKIIQDVMDKYGIVNKFARAAILGVISKESANAGDERGYQNTSNDRIRKIFGNRFADKSDAEIDALKADNEKFFNYVYGNWPKLGLGNTEPGDGYRYRGRGFNGITGRAIYQSLQDFYNKIGGGSIDIVKNPELLEKPDVAAEFAIIYFIKSFGRHFSMDAVQKMNSYQDVDTAVRDFVQANHGWNNPLSGYIGSVGLSKASNFANTLLASSSTASKTA